MQYAAIEFMPMTRNGNAQNWKPSEVEHGVKARQEEEAPAAAEEHPARGPDFLTTGQIPSRPGPSRPPDRCRPATTSQRTFAQPGLCSARLRRPGGPGSSCQRGDEAQRRIAAAVVRNGRFARKQVQEPGVERPGGVAVLVPVSREPGGMVGQAPPERRRRRNQIRGRAADKARRPPSSRPG